MQKIFLTLLCACGMISLQAVEMRHMREISISLQDADTDTLVIFDVDMVLVQPQDPAFQMSNIKRHGALAKRIMNDIPSDKLMLFFGLMTLHSEPVLIDLEAPHLIQELRRRGVPTMALTANLTGELAGVKEIECRRAEKLQALGIDFSTTAPYSHPIVFEDLPPYHGYFSHYFDGFFFVNGRTCSKGEALLAFLRRTQITPKKIIFIDDREENLKSVQEALEGRPTTYLGIHYMGALQYPSEDITESAFQSKWEALANETLQLH